MVMLQVDAIVQAESGLNFFNIGWLSFEDVIDVVPPVKVTCIVGKLTAAKLLDLIHLGAISLHFLRYGRNKIIEAVIMALGIEYD